MPKLHRSPLRTLRMEPLEDRMNPVVNFGYTNAVGGVAADQARDIVADSLGNVYIAGRFTGTVDFDPSLAVNNVTSFNTVNGDLFLAKYSPTGVIAWVRTVSVPSANQDIIDLSIDGVGNVYATGYFTGTVDFNTDLSGSDFFTSVGAASDVFVLKLDTLGNYLWAKSFGGFGNDVPNRMTLDPTNNVLVTGNFTATADFDPSGGIFSLNSFGASDVFATKLDQNGTFLWARSFGSLVGETAGGIGADAFGNVYLSGGFVGTADFDPGAGTFNLSSTSGVTNDIYVSKLDPNGLFVWARRMGGFSDDYSSDLAIDRDGFVYTTGFFSGSADFNPNPSIAYNLVGTGINTAYINKLDANGIFVYAGRINANVKSAANRIAVDPNGNAYVLGSFTGQIAFFNGAGNVFYNNAGNSDIFIAKLNRAGTFFTYMGTVGGFSFDTPAGLFIDRFGGILYNGSFNGISDLNPAGTVNLIFNGAGSDDTFFTRLVQSNVPSVGGMLANQLVYDNKTIAPLRTATIVNPFGDAIVATVKIVNGVNRGDFTLASAVGWTKTTSGSDYIYTRTFSAWNADALAQAAVRLLVFDPRENAITPTTREKTVFTLTVDNQIVAPVTNAGEFSTSTYSVNDTAVIGGAVANQPLLDTGTIAPFTTVTVVDPDIQTVTARVIINYGTIRGDFTPASTVGWTKTISGYNITYTRSVTGPNVGSLVQPLFASLVFDPLENRVAPPLTQKTTFTLSVIGVTAGSNTGFSTLATSVNDAPTLGGTVAGQNVPVLGTLKPFLAATITDPDYQPLQVKVTILNGVNRGIFTAASAAGWVRTTVGVDYVYTRTFNVLNVGAAAQTSVRALNFDPRVGALLGENTSFIITVNDFNAPILTDSTASVVTV
jgi:hypothetical protein